ncbi:MAG: acetyl-CoA carboxylase carboxyltransferase subunit beta [Agathobacter sp.]|nr:acetyl-CoA carboxylase carboxyltransferase subunit beta [Agathobacter sp.]
MSEVFLLKRKKLDSLKKMRDSFSGREEIMECPECQEKMARTCLAMKKFVCPECGHYYAVSARERIEIICDENSFKEMDAGLKTNNPIKFPNYRKKLELMKHRTGLEDAIITGIGKIEGEKVAIGVLDSSFLMGSMGTVVGERVARLAETARRKKLPLVIFSASGGARMQEGLFSLMQMAKTAAAVETFKNTGGLFVSVLTNPTTGGVSASYASLGDIMIAEPKALICFAGPRVIQQTIGQELPEGFQRAEFLLEHGMLDMVVERQDMKNVLGRIIKIHSAR